MIKVNLWKWNLLETFIGRNALVLDSALTLWQNFFLHTNLVSLIWRGLIYLHIMAVHPPYTYNWDIWYDFPPKYIKTKSVPSDFMETQIINTKIVHSSQFANDNNNIAFSTYYCLTKNIYTNFHSVFFELFGPNRCWTVHFSQQWCSGGTAGRIIRMKYNMATCTHTHSNAAEICTLL